MEANMATATRDNKGRFSSKPAKSKNGSSTSYGALAGAAAGGAALGLLAMFGRKAIVQAPTAAAGDWFDGLVAEHRAVMKLFDTLEATGEGATGKRSMLLTQIKHALDKHALEEENVIYPALRESGQAEEADALNKEHGYVKQYLYELENMPNDSPNFIPTVRRFRADLDAHIAEEEMTLFPALRAGLTEEKNKQLTIAMNKEGFKLA
jgi:hemerythrin superfamily protein